MANVTASELRVGNIIKYEGNLVKVTACHLHTPGNLRAMVQAKMKNIKNGNNAEYRFRSDEKVERVSLETIEMEYLYSDETFHTFMNTENYEQTSISNEFMGDLKYYLLPNTRFQVEFYEGNPIGIVPPQHMIMQIMECEPNMKGATVTSSMKPAKMETGLTVMVPQFVEAEEYIKFNTDNNTYLERTKKPE